MSKKTKCINMLVCKTTQTAIRTLGLIFFSWFLIGFIYLEFNPINWDTTTRATLVIVTTIFSVIMKWIDD